MRIGFLSTELTHGGAARAMLRTVEAVTAAGHEAVLITLARGDVPGLPVLRLEDKSPRRSGRVSGVAHYFYNGRLVQQNRSALSNTVFWTPAVGFDVADPISRLGLDVLNVHWTSYFLSLASLEQLMRLPAPVVFSLHDMAHLTGGCHYTAGCRRFETDCGPCPQLRTDWLRVPQATRRRRGELYDRYRPWAIAPSRWLAEEAERSGLFSDGRIVHAPNALDLDVFSPRRRQASREAFGIDPGDRVILFGALDNREERKGFDLLKSAMERLCADDAFLAGPPITVVGLGAHLPEIELPGIRVLATGHIDEDDRLAQVYSASDLVVLPSREDNLPNIMVEAMACGAPVCGFAIGGLKDLVDDGANGALARPFDTDDLALAIRRALDIPGSIARPAARRAAQHLASPAVHARRYLEVFERAREERDFAVPEGTPRHPSDWRPSSPAQQPGLTEFPGGLLAEAAIRMRAALP